LKARSISGSPALAAITLKQEGDGLTYAALFFERTLSEIANANVSVLELTPNNLSTSTVPEWAIFISQRGLEQLLNRRSWWLFNHVGKARAQNLAPIRPILLDAFA
jgi:hypothetical protein